MRIGEVDDLQDFRAPELAETGCLHHYSLDFKDWQNTGFVPLLNVHIAWRPGGARFGLLLDADALAAPQGRAEDVLLAITWQVRDGVELRAGYRTLEGGADNDEVYNFAWLHYAVIGIALTL